MAVVHNLDIPYVPGDSKIIQTTEADLSGLNCTEKIQTLNEKCMASVKLDTGIYAYALPKNRPYSQLDCMVDVQTPTRTIENISQLEPHQLKTFIKMCLRIQNALDEVDTDSATGISMIAINCQEGRNHYKEETKQQPLQTLKELHGHVVRYSEQELSQMSQTNVSVDKDSGISKGDFDFIYDPTNMIISGLLEIEGLREQLTKNLKVIKLKPDEEKYVGLNFAVASKQAMTSEEFAEDLITLHHNARNLYRKVIDLFIEKQAEKDEADEPILRNTGEREYKIDEFFSGIVPPEKEASPHINRMKKTLLKLGSILTGYPNANSEKYSRTFLTGFPYTLTCISTPDTDEVLINLQIKPISRGNAVSVLGARKNPVTDLTEKWESNMVGLKQLLEESIGKAEIEYQE